MCTLLRHVTQASARLHLSQFFLAGVALEKRCAERTLIPCTWSTVPCQPGVELMHTPRHQRRVHLPFQVHPKCSCICLAYYSSTHSHVHCLFKSTPHFV